MLTKAQFEALSEFRYQLKRFLHFSETAAKELGLTPLQVDVYLTDKGREYLQQLAQQHKTELQSLQNTFQVARITALNENYDADQ